MSHNSNKLNTQEPDRQGALSVALNDLSDVSGSPNDGQILTFDSGSGAWAAATTSPASAVEFIHFGRGESEPYDDSPAVSLAAGQVLNAYDTSPTNTISGATVATTATTGSGGGDWLDSFTLPVGTYRITCVANVEFSASGYFAFSIRDSANAQFTAMGTVGASVGTYSSSGPIATGIAVLTASTTLYIDIVAANGVDSVANQNNTPAQYTSLLVEKLA
jgi:hypothetical protein